MIFCWNTRKTTTRDMEIPSIAKLTAPTSGYNTEYAHKAAEGSRYVPSESLLMHSRHSVFFFPVGFHIDPSSIPVSLGVGLGVRTTPCRSTSRSSPSSCTAESGGGMSEDESLDAYVLGVGTLRNADRCGWACGSEGPHPAGALLSIVDDVSACHCGKDLHFREVFRTGGGER